MALFTGSASSFSDLKEAIEATLQANGWSLSNGILSKDTLYIKMTAAATKIDINVGTGQTGSTITGSPLFSGTTTYNFIVGSPSDRPITFPCSYDLYVFTDPVEVYCVINHDTDFYQSFAWGISNSPGLSGTGNWVYARFGHSVILTQTGTGRFYCAMTSRDSAGMSAYHHSGAELFFAGSSSGYASIANAVHTGTGHINGWAMTESNNTVGSIPTEHKPYIGLFQMLPSTLNGSTVLLPRQVLEVTGNSAGQYTNKSILTLNNARMTRNDNLVPGEIVTLGSESWKVYPFYKRDVTVRNGVNWSTGAFHSGTAAYAIRHPGV